MRDDGLLPVVLAPTVPAPDNASSTIVGMIVLEVGQVRLRISGPNKPQWQTKQYNNRIGISLLIRRMKNGPTWDAVIWRTCS
ncbi:hypothetical protein GJ699_33160 [Duganella sp. FT80W]|uniref:Uncharacterized protein n=1 Tax=Duganella guangzhouensis TaxID=2666084 RepID=A0A6I2L9A5_9BURK|nr:hypothetical protein [Duganella guangzhouensis]MRW94821.1 hypothetical protein [Duganella guangzhouensis]